MRVRLKYFLFILSFGCVLSKAQIPLDSISRDYFEKKTVVAIQKNRQKVKRDSLGWDMVNLGDDYSHINKEDSACFYWDLAIKKFKQSQDTTALFYILPRMIDLIDGQEYVSPDLSAFDIYETQLKELIGNRINDFNFFPTQLYQKKIFTDYLINKELDKAYPLIHQVSSHLNEQDSAILRPIMDICLGYYHAALNQYPDSVYYYYNKAIKKLKEQNDGLLETPYFNMAIYLHEDQGKHELALKYLDSATNVPNERYTIKNLRILYKRYVNLYKDLQKPEKAFPYQEAILKLNTVIDDTEQNLKINEIETRTTAEEIDKKLSLYEKLAEKYSQNRFLYTAALILSIFLAIYVIYRWQKENQRRKKIQLAKEKTAQLKMKIEHDRLEIEKQKQLVLLEKQKVEKEKAQLEKEKMFLEMKQQDTVKKLKKAKKMVIQDQIILKNNSNIKLSRLCYIKSSGHKIELHTNTGVEIIRHNLNDFKKYLTPNFQQCHRSYIVNTQHILQVKGNEIMLKNNESIPLSRSYQSDFNHLIR